MWLNSTAQNALGAVIYIAEHEAQGPVRVDDIAKALRCPRNYLSKTLHRLTQTGVLRSVRGPKGGFQLADPPDRLSVTRVVGPFERPGERRCLLGRPDCSDARACSAHHRWVRVASAIEEFFDETVVADLVRQPTRIGAGAT